MLADYAQWRRPAQGGQLWQLFYWLGRASDQVAGVVINPLVVALYARALEPDRVRLSWVVSGFALAWLAGTLISPWLQRLTVRVTPWVVGAYIVRTSAVALLAYSASERTSPADQRFRSVLICLIAYALATGVARAAHARQLSMSGMDISPAARTLFSELGLGAMMAVIALAAFEVLSSASLGWSHSFGRLFTLAAIALGVATLSAVKSSAAQRDIAEARPSAPVPLDSAGSDDRARGWSVAAILGVGLVAVSFIEVMVFFLLFQDFRRQSTDVRTATAFFVAGWAAGVLLWGVILRRFTASLVLQASIGCSTIGMIVGLGLRDFSRAEWFPDEVFGRSLIVMSIFAVGAIVGLGASGRREAALAIGPVNWRPTAPMAMAAAVGGILPVVIARLSQETSLDKAVAAGIAITLLVLILAGAVNHDGAIRRRSAALRSGGATDILVGR